MRFSFNCLFLYVFVYKQTASHEIQLEPDSALFSQVWDARLQA